MITEVDEVKTLVIGPMGKQVYVIKCNEFIDSNSISLLYVDSNNNYVKQLNNTINRHDGTIGRLKKVINVQAAQPKVLHETNTLIRPLVNKTSRPRE